MHSERSAPGVDDTTADRPEGRAKRPRARTVASRVDGLKLLAGALGELPVSVRFWDDSTVVARGNPDAPVVLIRDEQAIAHFLRAPNQLGLGRAWVSGSLDVDQQEEAGILSAEVRAKLADQYANGGSIAATHVEAPAPGQTALFNTHEDAVECARCGGRMVRTGSCYTCRDCGTNTGCS